MKRAMRSDQVLAAQHVRELIWATDDVISAAASRPAATQLETARGLVRLAKARVGVWKALAVLAPGLPLDTAIKEDT